MEILIMLFMLSFNPGGDLVATTSGDGGLALWSTETGEVVQSDENESGTISAISFSPDGQLIVTGDIAGNVIFRNAETLEIVASIPEHEGEVFSAAFTPDGTFAVTAGRDGFVNVWNVYDTMMYKKLKAHDGKVFTIAFSNDGKWLATCGDDSTIKFWKLPTLELKQTISDAETLALTFSPAELTLAASGGSGDIDLFDLNEDGEWASAGSIPAIEGYIGAIAYTADGSGILVVSDYEIVLTDIETGEVEILVEDENGIWSLKVSHDGTKFGYMNPDMTLQLIDFELAE